MMQSRTFSGILFAGIVLLTSQGFAGPKVKVARNKYFDAYLAAADSSSYEKATAHDPNYANKKLWPWDSKKSLYAQEKWKKARVLIWARPGQSSKMGQSLAPHNWLENGKPATAAIDENCDLVLPPAEKKYWVVMKGSKNPVPWIRHVTIGKNAGLVWLHGAKGNTWVKKGGTLKYLGWFSGSKNVFVRNDNPTSLGLVDHCYIHKADNASVEFLGAFHVADSFYPAKGQTILGPGCHMAPGSRSTLIVQPGATMTLLSGSTFTRSGHQIFGIDLIVKGTVLAGTRERPLESNARIALSWKGKRKGLSGEPDNKRRERPDDAGLVVVETGTLKITSKDPKKVRLVIDSNKLEPTKKHIYEGSQDRVAKLAKTNPGIDIMLLGKLDINGIIFNNIAKKGLVVKNPAVITKQWKNVSFGKENKGQFKELVTRWDGKPGFWFGRSGRDPWAGLSKVEKR